ncbi:Zinc finger protein MAGPIE [Platanthera guangdongensis]|uniref:Zinc finger protein MAGPIE n=1 Tax=Platanthera guangdongensis TaxID=2320717 RepID=A0ABR2MYV5_9ASPA
MEAFSSSSPFFIIREGHDHHLNVHHQQPQSPPPARQPPSNPQSLPPPAKKKRNVPGNPNPDAEVIALSPKTLMATNRFICEVCNKGFQREQNLQLHRRGHNLPWKLKQKQSGKEVRRRVYLCPEPGCVHHDPSRALGDLTGVKKHFSRKHGEKKWKCDKCAKRYAVQSDCKAHSKTCGTREYRCDCGTLFSRRDSFITHRAFCDALAQDGAGHHVGGLTAINGSHLYRNSDSSSAISLGLSHLNSSNAHSSLHHHQAQMHHPSPELLRLGVPATVSGQNISLATQFDHLLPTSPHSFSFRPPHSAPFFLGDVEPHQSKPPFHGLMQFPGLQSNSSHNPSSNLYNLNYFSNGGSENPNLMIHDQLNGGNLMTDDHIQCLFAGSAQSDNAAALPQMSATAMLQKAAQMGSTSNMGDQILRSQVENHERHLMDIMNSFANGGSGIFGGRPIDKEDEDEEEGKFGGFNAALCNMDEGNYQNNGLTRDFLGVGSLPRSVGRGMALDHHHGMGSSSRSFHGGDYSPAAGRGD